MEIVNAQTRFEWFISDFLQESFKDEEGEILYNLVLINTAVFCPKHETMEMSPAFRITLVFTRKNQQHSFRAEDVFDVQCTQELLREQLIDLIDKYRVRELEIDISGIEEE